MGSSRDRRRGRPGRAAAGGAPLSAGALDPLLHSPARLRIVGTLAALPGGDALSAARLQHLTGLDPGRLTADLGTLAGAGYVQADTAAGAAAPVTTLALTGTGRTALDHYTAGLQSVRAGRPRRELGRPRPDLRIGDADRDATAAALGEHFARGRLTLDELDARLGAAFTAVTQRELSRATSDLPESPAPPRPPAARPGRGGRGRRPGRPS